MEVVYKCCCGIDVHARSLTACLIKRGKKKIVTYSTMTGSLLSLRDWLVSERCTHVAIESTGVYWRPVFNILESHIEVMLVNAREVKGRPGRKTDVCDSEWLADLLRHGLLKASFIPPLEIRELRELTRYREGLVRHRTAVVNRIHKVVESGNIKLGEVATNVLGVSGKLMLKALAMGESDAEKMSELARGRLKKKKEQLERALQGRLTSTQRWVLQELLERYDEIDRAVAKVEREIERQVLECPDTFVREAVSLLETIPGISKIAAQNIVSEIGVDMSKFPSDRHLSSWAAMCPGNNESAGKRKNGKTGNGDRYLKAALTEAAWAASHTKNTYLAAQYHRLARRIGKKRALVAVGHSILIIIYHVLGNGSDYRELGGNYFDQRNTDKLKRSLVRRLESLGLVVTIEEAA